MMIYNNGSWINTEFISQIDKGYIHSDPGIPGYAVDLAHFIDEDTWIIRGLHQKFQGMRAVVVTMNNNKQHVFLQNTTSYTVLRDWLDSQSPTPGAP